jgi:hypothetical protein
MRFAAASIIVATLVASNTGLLAGQVVAPQSEVAKLRPSGPGTISLHFQRAELKDVFTFLGSATGIEIMWPADVRVTDPVNVYFNNAAFQDVFTFLVAAGKLDYVVIDEKTVVLKNKSQ